MATKEVTKFDWQPQYETHIKVIDRQHRELFEHIDKLTLAMYRGDSVFELNEIMGYLDKYITEHFITEERLMSEVHYSQYFEHKAEHNHFKELYESLLKDFNIHGPDSYFAIRIEKEIRGWWEKHVLKTDMKYVPYIKV